MRRRATLLTLTAVVLAGALLTIAPAFAKKPPKCDTCAPTITLPDGRVCTLSACGSDCVYTCPL